MTKQIRGMHHVSAMTSDAKRNYEFFTNIMGMRLVKKTVNQDDVQAYHLFYADDKGNPGTDMTFFQFGMDNKKVDGTDSIHRTSFRVPNDKALKYWKKRFEHYNVKHTDIKERFGIQYLEFNDFDDQNYQLISDEHDNGMQAGEPWHKGPVPDEYSIYGLGPIILKVSKFEAMKTILEEVYGYKETKIEEKFHLFEVDKGGNGASIYVEEDTESPRQRPGYGSVHHFALRVDDQEALSEWFDFYNNHGFNSSGLVDRFYFGALYARIYPQILIELSTDGPGFIDYQETYEILGEKLALPPKFEPYRQQIEELIEPIDTVRSNKTFEKEYLNFE